MKKNYPRSWRVVLVLLILLSLESCEKFEFSPHEVLLRDGEKNLNQHHIGQLQAQGLQPGDTIRIALISDTQRYYDETDQVVGHINARSRQKGKRIHFVIHGGDITDFGMMDEHRWIHDRMKKLQMPFLTVIGNHDCLGNGKVIYAKMYGPDNFSFTLARNRFVFLNTNYLEYKENRPPNLEYMQQALQNRESYDNAFVISHVPPFHEDFDPGKERAYAQLINQYQVKYSIHGHLHTHRDYGQHYQDQGKYLVIGGVEHLSYLVMTIVGQQVSYEVVKI
ncbi:MAG: metallophosphoesterase family protein [Adhaeribacter sp.]